MTAALRAQLDAIGEQAVQTALDTLRREHQERELDGRVLDVVTQTMQAAWAARLRLRAAATLSEGIHPRGRVTNCPVCVGLGCNDCCHTGRATTSAAGDGASLGSTPSPAVSTS